MTLFILRGPVDAFISSDRGVTTTGGTARGQGAITPRSGFRGNADQIKETGRQGKTSGPKKNRRCRGGRILGDPLGFSRVEGRRVPFWPLLSWVASHDYCRQLHVSCITHGTR